MQRVESVSNLLPDIQKLFEKPEKFLLLGKKLGELRSAAYGGILRPNSNKSLRMPLGLHMGCIRSLFSVLYRFEIFFFDILKLFRKADGFP